MHTMKKTLILEDLCCANCAQKIEDAVNKLEAVQSCNVAFLTQKMKLELDDENSEKTIEEIKKIIKKIEPDTTVVEK